MKTLLFSDLHMRPETEEVTFQVLHDLAKTAQELQVKRIGFLGDFWHCRYAVPVHLVNGVADWVAYVTKCLGIGLDLLPGNHDQIDLLGNNALQVFREWGARVFTDPEVDEYGIGWMPYRKDPEIVKDCLEELLSEGAHTLFAHLPFKGAMMNNMMADTDGLDPSVFLGFKRVLLGHYHKRQSFVVNTTFCEYIGSPWQTRSDEYGQPKGFGLYDHQTGQLQFLDRKFGKQHHRIEVSSPAELIAHVMSMDVKTTDSISVVLPTKELLQTSVAWLQTQGFQNILGNSKETEVSQPRFGFTKSTTLSEYALAFATDKGKDVAPLEDLMKVWTEIT